MKVAYFNEIIFDNGNLLPVSVVLEPIDCCMWYEMRREKLNIPTFLDATKKECVFCLENLDSSPYIKCAECTITEVLICFTCFRHGAQMGEHRRGHNYEVCDSIGPPIFEDAGKDEWGCNEDLTLLWSFYKSHLDQWHEISKDIGSRRSLNDALDRIDKYFLRSDIGAYLLKKYCRSKINVWVDDLHIKTDLKPILSNQLHEETNGVLDSSSSSNLSKNKRLKVESLPSPPSSKKLRSSKKTQAADSSRESLDDDEFLTSANIGKRRFSTRTLSNISIPAPETPTTSSSEFLQPHRTSRKDLLETAKNEAAEALRGRYSMSVRKSSLDLSEAINKTDEITKKRRNSDCVMLADDEMKELYRCVSGNLYFYSQTPSPLSQPSKFDPEDLQLVTYNPMRDEFDVEYKNDAEKLISQINFEREYGETDEVAEFKDEVRFAQLERYNRLMKMRVAKHAIIREHGIMNEFFSIVKSNVTERGKYNLLDDRYFPTKNREDFFKPLLFQLRQVAHKKTINTLARNIGMMETLKDQIQELQSLKKKGITEIKGKLKTETSPTRSVKRRKSKKFDNYARKANNRWKRIIRWTKKTNNQLPESSKSRNS